MRHARQQAAHGFTLVELVLSMAVTAILLTGLTSAVIVAAQALPGKERVTDKVLQQTRVLDQLVAELQYAGYIAERGTQAITFTVADRNSDGSPERVRYAWSGTAGDPLTRQYNGGTAVTVLEDVRQFDLGYDVKGVTERYPGLPVEGDETVINSYTGSVSLKDFSITSSDWVGQYFAPSGVTFTANSATWRLTRVLFLPKRDGGNDGQVRVQIREANSDYTPSSTVLEEYVLYESDLSLSYAWNQVSFNTIAGLGSDDGVCLVLAYKSGTANVSKIWYDNSGGSGRVNTSNTGSSWTYASGKSLDYYAYGKVCEPGPDQTLTRQYVTGVRVGLRAGAESTAALSTTARTFNTPEVLSGYWEADFSVSPTVLDMNGDGVVDWVRQDAQAFSAASLSGGVWTVDAAIDTQPTCDFTVPTTIEMRLRNTDTSGNGNVFSVNTDWSGSNVAPLAMRLLRLGTGMETLMVFGKTSDTNYARLTSVAGLSDYVDVRLLIDPTLNSVNIGVNGSSVGTFSYYSFSAASYSHCASLLSTGSGLNVDHVRIRVGGS